MYAGNCKPHGAWESLDNYCPTCAVNGVTDAAMVMPSPVMPGVSLYEAELKQLIDAMRYKLKKNQHKGRWEGLTLPKAIELMKEEVEELIEASTRDSSIEVILEAADVANFAMIIANLAMKRAASV